MSMITPVYETVHPETTSFSFSIDLSKIGQDEAILMLFWLLDNDWVDNVVAWPSTYTFNVRFKNADDANIVLDEFCGEFHVSPYDTDEEDEDE